MSITVKDISRLAKVSRTTVYRALENKQGINEETKKRILQIAQGLNYTPNRLGKALAKKKRLALGVVTLPLKNPFARELLEGVREAEKELIDYGLVLRIESMEDLDATNLAKKIDDFASSRIRGITLNAINSPEVVEAVNRAVDCGIPVITFNSDLKQSKRLCFVGQDLFKSGQVAADLLCRFIGLKGKVFILNGFHRFSAHKERLSGFQSVIKDYFKDIEVVGIEEDLDDDFIAFEKTSKVLRDHPDLSGIYIVGAGVSGACNAVKRLEIGRKVKLVCNDLVPETTQFLKEGIIDATIYQDPFTQGKLPVKLLFDILFQGVKPTKEIYFTKTEIITKYLI